MVKKILYCVVTVALGFVIFAVSLYSARGKAVNRRGNEALEKNDYEFFLKFNDCYEKEPFLIKKYEENDNTTVVRFHYACSLHDDISGFLILITDINQDTVFIDEKSLDDKANDEIPASDITSTKITLTTDNGMSWTAAISTYGYTDLQVATFSFADELMEEKFSKDGVAPKYITNITIADQDGVKFFEASDEKLVEIKNYTNDDWNAKVDNGTAGVRYTDKELNKYFYFSYPEMWRVWLSTIITLLLLTGLGLFIFWPKKKYVPDETDDKRNYTYAPTSEQPKRLIEAADQTKKEREARENRYKNVRAIDEEDTETDEEIIEETSNEEIDEVVEETNNDQIIEETNDETSIIEPTDKKDEE